jgi:biofilm PGA synthesis protein PgaD
MKNLIFTEPSLAPLPHRIGWAFFTAFFWIVWIYLWLPLVTIALWAMGIEGFYHYFFEGTLTQELARITRVAINYSTVTLVLGGSLLLWARVEFMRFRNLSRRLRPHRTSPDDLARFALLPAHDIAEWQTARRVIAHHDDHGHLLRADVLE